MKLNKLVIVFALLTLNNSVTLNLCADDEKALSNTKDSQERKIETKAYKGKKLTSLSMNLFDHVLVKFPTTSLRMAMAADRGQKIVDAITKLSPIGATKGGEPVYFESKEQEQEYVKKQLAFVLEPVEKFMDNVKEHRSLVKNLLKESFGEKKAEKSLISTALEVEGSFLKYFSVTIKKVSELHTAATEFLMFFADINESLSPAAKEALDKLVEKIRANKKQSADNK